MPRDILEGEGHKVGEGVCGGGVWWGRGSGVVLGGEGHGKLHPSSPPD